jgi:hypothetical protein
MADILNLRLARKRKAREDAARKADENRIVHGRTGTERREAKLRTETEQRRLDGHHREAGDEDDR